MTEPGDSIWASLPVPAFIIDSADAIRDINPPAEQFLNASARTTRGQRVNERLSVDATLETAFARVRGGLSPIFIGAVDVAGGSAAAVTCDIRIAPFSGKSGHLLLMIEPCPAAARHGRSRSASSAARSAIGMAEMLAHEIRNPLAGITGAAQLLSMELESGDRELTDLIVGEARRIVSLLEKVDQFGKLAPPERRSVNLHDLLDRARRSAQVGIAAGMRIVEDYDPSLPLTYVDEDQILQVLANLLRNAAEASRGREGVIALRTYYDRSLRLRQRDGSGGALPLQVEIIDDGPGIPPEIEHDIFDPFVTGRANGAGLGLALASRIISEHGGWISVDSVPGRTAFRISLPVAPEET